MNEVLGDYAVNKYHLHPRIASPTRLMRRPTEPTVTRRTGCSMPSGTAILLMDSTRMEKQRARRNTALTRAPKTSARAQPNVFFAVFFFDIWKMKKKTHKIEKLKVAIQRTEKSSLAAEKYLDL